MEIYTYTPDVNRYDGLCASGRADAIMTQEFQGVSLATSWKPLKMKVDVSTGKMGDFPGYPAGPPIFSEHAWQVLQPLLGASVEALPLEFKGGSFFAINVLEVVDCLDQGRSDIGRFPDGSVISIHDYVFKAGCLKKQLMFRLPEDLGHVLVTEPFRDCVMKHKLKGLLWDKIAEVDG
jgi:hypothetical protein